MEVLSWDEYFISVAFLSSLRSIDSQHKGGACIVNKENRIVGIGYCGFPRGMDCLPQGHDRELFICHAVMNAILNKNQYDVRGCRIYTTRFPCSDCAKLIIQAGLSRVVYNSGLPTDATQILFTLAGVSLLNYIPRRQSSLRVGIKNVDDESYSLTKISQSHE